MSEAYKLTVIFHTIYDVIERSERFDEPLDTELTAIDIGSVMGGGTGSTTSDIVVEVHDLKRGLQAIRKVLRKAGAPAGTTIIQNEPVGMAYHLASNSPPPKKATNWKGFRRVSFNTGDVVAIPLGERMYGYVRVYRDCDVGAYEFISDGLASPKEVVVHPVAFIVGCCYPDDQGKDWIKIGSHDFESDEAAWGPPRYINSVINPDKYQILHKGTVRDVEKPETDGLETCTLWFPENIKKRILKEVPPNQQVDPIVTTPVDEVEAQSTQGHP